MNASDEYSTLRFVRRGERFALVRTYEDQTTEFELLESEILSLGRIAPSYARALIATKTQPGSGISAWVAAPVQDYGISSDLHNHLVLLRIHDEHEAEFDFSLEPAGARRLGEDLITWANWIESAPRPTQQ